MISGLGMRGREGERERGREKNGKQMYLYLKKKICHFYIDEDKCFLQAHVLVNKRNGSWDYGQSFWQQIHRKGRIKL